MAQRNVVQGSMVGNLSSDDETGDTTRPPSRRGPLGLKLTNAATPEILRGLDLASLILVGLSDHDCSPVAGILDGVAKELFVLAYANEKLGGELGNVTDVTDVILSAHRRVLVASELHRRMVEERDSLDETTADSAPEIEVGR